MLVMIISAAISSRLVSKSPSRLIVVLKNFLRDVIEANEFKVKLGTASQDLELLKLFMELELGIGEAIGLVQLHKAVRDVVIEALLEREGKLL
ncbi:hypothetical protein TorRG33x02_130840 [Trema orientale]|uniref:Uncharacterized protein n=1 Tax=Trema orientale TaxID=63057 RepID=A0A2P5EZT8_TREOI|nr:hypothetical protein TorRG33x02_130840 [Trema orientale]